MIASHRIVLVVIATTAASMEMTGVPLVVAMPAAAARVLLVVVRLLVVRAARVMIAVSAANAGPTAEMDSTVAMIALRVNATRHHLWCRG